MTSGSIGILHKMFFFKYGQHLSTWFVKSLSRTLVVGQASGLGGLRLLAYRGGRISSDLQLFLADPWPGHRPYWAYTCGWRFGLVWMLTKMLDIDVVDVVDVGMLVMCRYILEGLTYFFSDLMVSLEQPLCVLGYEWIAYRPVSFQSLLSAGSPSDFRPLLHLKFW